MAITARLPFAARRFELRTFTIIVRGLDLTGVNMAMQVRLSGDTPGAPLLSLATVTTVAAEGLKLESVEIVDGLPVSTITGRINKASMSDAAGLGRVGEPGLPLRYAYAVRFGDITRIAGDFWALPGTFDADNASPTGDYAGGQERAPEPFSSTSLTIAENELIALTIDGAEVLSALKSDATQQAELAKQYALSFEGGTQFADLAQDDITISLQTSGPNDQFDYNVDVNGRLSLTINRPGGLVTFLGPRTKMVRKIGRKMRHSVMLGATNAVANQPGIAFGFDPKGEGQVTDPSTVYVVCRAGSVLVENISGQSVAGYTVTNVTGGAPPTYAGGDYAFATFTEEVDATGASIGRFTFTKGTTERVFTVKPLPPGNVIAAVRGSGSEAAPWSAAMDQPSWSGPAETAAPQFLIGQQAPATTYGSPIRAASSDANAYLPRALPPGIPDLPIYPVAVHGPGHCDINQNAAEAFFTKYPAIKTGNVIYASPTGGTSGALNDRSQPSSLNHALKNSAAQHIICLPGDYDPIDFRRTDGQGTLPQAIIAETPGTCRMRRSGPSLAGLTFTATSGQAGMWQAAVATDGIHRLARSDKLDRFGFPARIRRYATQAELAAATTGYFFDGTTLFIKNNGGDVNAIKSVLLPFYGSSVNTARIFQQGTEILMQGWRIEGLMIGGYSSGANPPIFWGDNCLQLFSSSYGIHDYSSSSDGEYRFYLTRWRGHASEVDTVQTNDDPEVPGAALGIVANSWLSEPGDYLGLGPNGSPNKQNIASHGGNMVVIGCLLEAGYGQEAGDGSDDPTANNSWYVGTLARDASGNPDQGIGFSAYGTGGGVVRQIWLDTCSAPGMAIPLELSSGAVGHVFNSPDLLPAQVSLGSVQPTNYLPGAPA